MLFGMAALKTGFLTGDWSDARYRKVALIGFGIAIPAYAILASLMFADDFSAGRDSSLILRRDRPVPAADGRRLSPR